MTGENGPTPGDTAAVGTGLLGGTILGGGGAMLAEGGVIAAEATNPIGWVLLGGTIIYFGWRALQSHNQQADDRATPTPPNAVCNCPADANPSSRPRPPNMAPEGATRDEALGKLREDNGLPNDHEPDNRAQRPNDDPREKADKGAETLTVLDADGNPVDIPHHYGGHEYPDDPTQNRGPHFNAPDGSHYDYVPPGEPVGILRR